MEDSLTRVQADVQDLQVGGAKREVMLSMMLEANGIRPEDIQQRMALAGITEGKRLTLEDKVAENANDGMQRSRAWCGTPPILGVVNMVGTRNFTCYMGAL